MVRDMPSIYQVPMLLEQQGVIPLLKEILKLDQFALSSALVSKGHSIWAEWKTLTATENRFFETVTIVLVGKYVELHDSYLSVIKSLEHSAMRCKRKLDLQWVDSEHLEPATGTHDPAKFHKAWHAVCTAAGILVPGGFGQRGTEGMIAAAKWARENRTPYLGICLGMQIAVIEFARNVCGIAGATSEEFGGSPSPSPSPSTNGSGSGSAADSHVIMFMPEVDKASMGATMRLGLRPTLFQPGSEWSRLRALYADREQRGGGSGTILERHRHRYEVNPAFIERLEKGGLSFVGKDDKGERMEIIELKDHSWFVGVQFHPEYLSRVLDPSRPYLGFVAASAGLLGKVTAEMKGERVVVNGVKAGVEV